jgi:ParB family chromosome partitioning protein
MAQQGGLGRGLSSLIPQRNIKNKNKKTAVGSGGVKRVRKAKVNSKKVSSVKESSVGEANYFGSKAMKSGNFGGSKKVVENKSKEKGISLKSVMEVGTGEVIPNPYQPRTNFDPDKLQELADSIAAHGIIQPLVVSHNKNGGYELIAGERRLEASKLAGLDKVPVVVREVTEQNKAEWALIENIQRHNLNPVEEAKAYERIKEDFNLTQDEIAKKVGKSRSAVANTLRLLNLPEEIQEALSMGKITEGHARTILALKDESKQLDLFNSILKEGLNVRQVEGATKDIKISKNYRIKKDVDPDLLDLENKIADNLNTKVKIRGIKNNGKILIDYYSEEELGQIVEKLRNER